MLTVPVADLGLIPWLKGIQPEAVAEYMQDVVLADERWVNYVSEESEESS